ncbi:hypothetical protein OAU53_00360 [Candidatus Pelagibacter sp.]|nr:hypothetical protein [Candidatus Pelagibacter sp.]
MNIYYLKKKNFFFVGDMNADKEFAKNANVDFIGASYGYGKIKSRKKINKITDLDKFL